MVKEYKFERSGKGRPKPLLYKISAGGCWENTSHIKDRDGYGKIQVDGKSLRIHRLVYGLENNIVLTEQQIVRHKCDNPSCFNPEHLELGSIEDNVADRVERNRSAKNETHGRSKLTCEQVIEIYYAKGSQISIAQNYGVSQRTVSLIKRKEIHRDILEDL